MHPVLESMKHRRATAEDSIFHNFLPKIFSTFFKTGFDHFGETFIVADLFEDDFTW